MQKYRPIGFNLETNLAFIDYDKAYNRIYKDKGLYINKKEGIPDTLSKEYNAFIVTPQIVIWYGHGQKTDSGN